MEREQILTGVYKLINNTIFNGLLPISHFKITAGQRSNAGWGITYQDDKRIYVITVSQAKLREKEYDIYANLFHQIVHILNMECKIADTSRDGRYHNKYFNSMGEGIGLIISQDDISGYSKVDVPKKMIDRLTDYQLERKLKQATINDTRVASRKLITYCCPICNRVAKASKNMKLHCGYCDVVMIPKP